MLPFLPAKKGRSLAALFLAQIEALAPMKAKTSILHLARPVTNFLPVVSAINSWSKEVTTALKDTANKVASVDSVSNLELFVVVPKTPGDQQQGLLLHSNLIVSEVLVSDAACLCAFEILA